MIIRSKAPLRLGLAGGGSDVSPYSDLYGGQILNATINLSAYCTIETQPGETVRIDAYDCDTHVECPLDAALAPAPDLIRGVYRRVVQDFGPVPGAFRITTYNDAPAGSGLGTSSTMVVCILKCFAEWLNLPLGDYETARLAYEIERKDLALAGGKQDQYAAAFGGFNFMEFHQDDIVIVNPLKIKSHLLRQRRRHRGDAPHPAKFHGHEIRLAEGGYGGIRPDSGTGLGGQEKDGRRHHQSSHPGSLRRRDGRRGRRRKGFRRGRRRFHHADGAANP